VGAKAKLNGGAVRGALLVAGLVGLLTDSATIFAVTLTVLLVASVAAGEIRR
jgi:hypothetical protein